MEVLSKYRRCPIAQFIKHTNCPSCGSSDGLAVYDDGSCHCFIPGCGYTIVSEEYKEANNKSKKPKRKEVMQKEEEKPTKEKPVITEEQKETVKSETGTKGHKFRNLEDKITVPFGVRYSYAEESGDVIEQYYPITQAGELVGYKVREVPKDFRSIGRTGATTECFMQFKFTRGGKYVVLTEGEIDALSAYQMFKAYNDNRGVDYEIAVVSATTGANSARQIANNYKFFDSFENIVIAYDNDTAGQKAIESIVKVLPKGKVKIMQMKHKDANEYLEKGDQKSFISDFYNAKSYTPAGVVGSSKLYEAMLSNAIVEKVPLPPFMRKLDEMLGSIELGTIGVFAAGSGAAKTTVANEMIYYWLWNSPHKVGIVSLELTCAQYGQAMLSRHIQHKISRIRNPQEKLEFLQQSHIKDRADELFLNSDGFDRFMLIDERDGSVETLQDKIEELIISCGCKVIVLDPLSDILDSLDISEQAVFMKWCKSMIKNYNVTFIMIAHIRKSGNNKDAASTGAFIPEEAITGSSTIFKSASWVVMMMRDKYNEDPIVKNTTKLVLSKNRSGGETGDAGELFYDNQTHVLHDKEEWLKSSGVNNF